jgi:hypothetical protein
MSVKIKSVKWWGSEVVVKKVVKVKVWWIGERGKRFDKWKGG